MYKILVVCCLLVSCFAGPFGLQSWSHVWQLRPRGCSDWAAGWQACRSGAAAVPRWRRSGAALAPHPRDCRLFYYCRHAAPPACRRCPAGLHFSPALQVCDWPHQANCTARPPQPWPTPGLPPTNPATTADPEELNTTVTTSTPISETWSTAANPSPSGNTISSAELPSTEPLGSGNDTTSAPEIVYFF